MVSDTDINQEPGESDGSLQVSTNATLPVSLLGLVWS